MWAWSRVRLATPLLVAVAVLAAAPAPGSGLAAQRGRATPARQRCADEARQQARKLLVFHAGADDRIEIDPSVKTLPPMRNPANRAQRFDVLEVWGRIYKGEYRMRFIYAQVASQCVLMGEEVLEFASL